MEVFKDYFLCAVGFCLIAEYARYLVADKFKPYVKFICGLFIVLMIAGPAYNALTEFFDDVPEIGIKNENQIPQDAYTGYIDTFKNRLALSVSDCIASNTDLTGEDFKVDIFIDPDNLNGIKISLIKITLYKNYDRRVVNNVVSTTYGVETETVIEYEKSE